MEIKVICECGTKYKFDVVPVDGHMPQAVKCPTCGANGTAQANTAIREGLGLTSAEATAVPMHTGAATPAAPTQASGLRINVHRPPPTESAVQASHVRGVYPGAVSVTGSGSIWTERGKKAVQLAWKGVLVVLCIIAMLAGFGGKKGKRLRFLARITSAVFRANAADEEAQAVGPKNLWGQDMVLLLLKHANEAEVAEACSGFWQEAYKKKVTFVETNEFGLSSGRIAVVPAYNGCVQIVGGLDWREEDFEKLTQMLSQKFNTVAVETRDVDFSGAYVFGVFENGEKKFRAELEFKGKTLEDMEEFVTVEGEDWAREHGFKPGEDGFNEFHLGEGDLITQRLGFDLSGQTELNRVLLLTEVSVTNRPSGIRTPAAGQTAKGK